MSYQRSDLNELAEKEGRHANLRDFSWYLDFVDDRVVLVVVGRASAQACASAARRVVLERPVKLERPVELPRGYDYGSMLFDEDGEE